MHRAQAFARPSANEAQPSAALPESLPQPVTQAPRAATIAAAAHILKSFT
ncbi:MAG TPA: hypothetical protein VHZ73_10915 [Vicinamibacterales bacterium]|nr:hypothetical protein [Vicinamibacterales bacterium]